MDILYLNNKYFKISHGYFLFKQETSSVGVVCCANNENTCPHAAQFTGKEMYRLQPEAQTLLSTKINSGNSYKKLYLIL